MNNNLAVSVIITTYNWPLALDRVLAALAAQTYTNLEVIIADDGSSEATRDCIQNARSVYSLPIIHIWQPDTGCQAAKIRNKAVSKASGDYLIFIDGDCIPMSHFIQKHVMLAQMGWFVAGNRVLLNETFTSTVLCDQLSVHLYTLRQWWRLRKFGLCNRLLPLLSLPFPRKLSPYKWQGAKTCNLAVWKQDFLAVNGFDETYQGWGYEDSDLVVRLFNHGVRRKEGRFAVAVAHLWHKEQDRSREKQNLVRFEARKKSKELQATLGIKQYLNGSEAVEIR